MPQPNHRRSLPEPRDRRQSHRHDAPDSAAVRRSGRAPRVTLGRERGRGWRKPSKAGRPVRAPECRPGRTRLPLHPGASCRRSGGRSRPQPSTRHAAERAGSPPGWRRDNRHRGPLPARLGRPARSNSPPTRSSAGYWHRRMPARPRRHLRQPDLPDSRAPAHFGGAPERQAPGAPPSPRAA